MKLQMGEDTTAALNKVVWLIGTPFSGSTVLGQALNENPNFVSAGEVDRLEQFGIHEHISGHSLKECGHCKNSGQKCSLWTPAFISSLTEMGFPLYEAIAKQSRCANVVDGSKTPYWFLKTLESEGIDELENRLVVVHCVRNPLAYAESLARKKITHPRAAISQWIEVNASCLYVINRIPFPVPVITIRHNDFLKNPERFVRTIAEICRGSEKKQLFNRPGISGNHDLGGNLAASRSNTDGMGEAATQIFSSTIDFLKTHGPLKEDSRWIRNLSAGDKWSLRNMHGLWDMVRLLGLEEEINDGMAPISTEK